MSETLAELPARAPSWDGFRSAQIGWRNLWRNKRRTWLTSGGIAFAILLVMFSMAMQHGQYSVMMENATTLVSGHIQVQATQYVDSERFEHTIEEASVLRRQLLALPDVVAVAPRVEAFALVSSVERSFGARILGIDVAAERATVRLLDMIDEGHAPVGPEDAVIGEKLARNLDVKVGDELVILGAEKHGGVAALVVNVVGILSSGMADLDRSLLLLPIAAVQNAFGLGDEIHTFAIRIAALEDSEAITARLASRVPADITVRNWNEVLPGLEQAIEVDRLGGLIMYGMIILLVTFSVVNTFIMLVFERTREFGMLLAIGMRPGGIVRMVLWEAFFVWLVGAALGASIAIAIIVGLADVGLYMGEAMEEMAAQYYMPPRLYPALTTEALLVSPLILLLGTQLAALIPALRIRRLRPVEALRSE